MGWVKYYRKSLDLIPLGGHILWRSAQLPKTRLRIHVLCQWQQICRNFQKGSNQRSGCLFPKRWFCPKWNMEKWIVNIKIKLSLGKQQVKLSLFQL